MDNITQTLMRGAGSGGGSATPTDPNFNQVALLLHGDGTNGSQNNTFVDSSTNNFSITRNGNATQGTFSPFSLPDGQWSNYFDGNGDFFTTPSNAAFDQNAGDWTIESWVYLTASVNATYGTVIFGQEFTRQVKLAISNTGVAVLDQAGVGVRVTGTTVLQIGQWYHLAAVRNGSTLSLYVNGVSEGTPNTTTTFAASGNTIHIARRPDIAYFLTGYISNLRFVKGTALYTANFTPPITSLTAITNTSLLTCQSNRFKDNSSNNFTLTRNGDVRVTAFSPFAPTSAYNLATNGGSGYFDGNGDYVWVGDNSALNPGTGDFTIECWVYHTNTSTTAVYVDKPQSGIAFARLSDNKLSMIQSGVAARVTSSGTLLANTWYHVAASRSGTTTRLFINGVQDGSGTDNSNYSCANSLIVGASASTASPTPSSPTNYMVGYISNLRILKGTALYTSNFTPPTAPLTAVTNTSLLLNFTNAGIVDNAGKNVLETVGNAQVSTSVTKFGTGSIFINGSGQYLTAPAQPQLSFGTGNFTIECWINPTGTQPQYAGIYVARNGTNPVVLSFSGSFSPVGATIDGWLTGGTVAASSTATITSGSWTHIAFVRNNGVCTIYVNGVAGSTTTTNNANIDSSLPNIGRDPFSSSRYFTGYIDDLRITKGIARYTADFTPPSAPYPDL